MTIAIEAGVTAGVTAGAAGDGCSAVVGTGAGGWGRGFRGVSRGAGGVVGRRSGGRLFR